MSFHVTTASVLGREHARLLRNNQDGVAARVVSGVAVAVVTDGCGSGASSEVGARLGARFLAQVIPGLAREVGVGPRLAERATDALLAWVYEVVRPLDVEGAGLAGLVSEQWLFTVLCAVMDEKSALIFGIGDGVWSANGVERVLQAGEGNAPDYLAYRIVPRAQVSTVGKLGVPVVHFCGEAQELAIATDGLASLDFCRDERGVWRNPYGLQRKVTVLAPHDDATVALMKRSA